MQICSNIGGYNLHISRVLRRQSVFVEIDEIGNIFELNAQRNVARGESDAPFHIETHAAVEVGRPLEVIRQIMPRQKIARFAIESAACRNQHRIFLSDREHAFDAAIDRKIAQARTNQIDIAIDIESKFFALAFEDLRSHTQIVFGVARTEQRIVFVHAETPQIVLHKARQAKPHDAIKLLLERKCQHIFQRPIARRVERRGTAVVVVVVHTARNRILLHIATAHIFKLNGVRNGTHRNVVVRHRIFGNLPLFFVAKTKFMVVVVQVINISRDGIQARWNVVRLHIQRLFGVKNVLAIGNAAIFVVAEIVEHHHALRRVATTVVTAPKSAIHQARGLVGILSATIDEIDQCAEVCARIGIHRKHRFEMVLLIECG